MIEVTRGYFRYKGKVNSTPRWLVDLNGYLFDSTSLESNAFSRKVDAVKYALWAQSLNPTNEIKIYYRDGSLEKTIEAVSPLISKTFVLKSQVFTDGDVIWWTIDEEGITVGTVMNDYSRAYTNASAYCQTFADEHNQYIKLIAEPRDAPTAEIKVFRPKRQFTKRKSNKKELLKWMNQ